MWSVFAILRHHLLFGAAFLVLVPHVAGLSLLRAAASTNRVKVGRDSPGNPVTLDWPSSLSFAPDEAPLPRLQWRLPAAVEGNTVRNWRKVQAAREKQLRRGRELESLFGDEAGSALHGRLPGEDSAVAAKRLSKEHVKELFASVQGLADLFAAAQHARIDSYKGDANMTKQFEALSPMGKRDIISGFMKQVANKTGADLEASLAKALAVEDTELWAPAESFELPSDSGLWVSICEGVNDTLVNELRASTGSKPFDDWEVVSNRTCRSEDMLAGTFTSEKAAYEACGSDCASVVDDSCGRAKFKLCALGSQEAKSNTTCLRWKPAGAPPPNGIPDDPKERALWQALCADVKMGPPYRLLWEQRECINAGAIVLEGARSPGRCSELAKEDPRCGPVFEFQDKDALPRCRCIPKGQRCDTKEVDAAKFASEVNILMDVPAAAAAR